MSESVLPYSDPSFRETSKKTTHLSPSCWFPPQLTSLWLSKNQAVLLQEATPFFLLHISASSLSHLLSFSTRAPGVSARLHNFSDKWQQQMVRAAKHKGRSILLRWVRDLLLLQQLTTVLLPHSSVCGTDLGVSQLLRPSWESNVQAYRILRGYNFHGTFSRLWSPDISAPLKTSIPQEYYCKLKSERNWKGINQTYDWKLTVVIKNLYQYIEM